MTGRLDARGEPCPAKDDDAIAPEHPSTSRDLGPRPPRWTLARASLLILVLGTLVAVGVVLIGDGESGGAGSRLVQRYAPEDRVQIEDFTAELLDGSAFDTRDLRGKVSVFNVWGSWCGPCREEAPDLARVSKEFEDDVQFVGINVRDSADAARAFERSFDVPYPSIRPQDSATATLAFGGALASAAVPSTVVLDVDGRVAARVVGTITYSTLQGLVEDAIAEAVPSGR